MALKNKSTLSAGLILETIIANHLDIGEYVAKASLDLSAAFDIVNIETLKKRLKIIGLPNNVLRLFNSWLTNRSCYYVTKVQY